MEISCRNICFQTIKQTFLFKYHVYTVEKLQSLLFFFINNFSCQSRNIPLVKNRNENQIKAI